MTKIQESQSQQYERISSVAFVESGGYLQLVRRGIFFIATMLLVFILWAAFTKIDEVAVSFGDVQPMQDVQSIQHLQGGVVAEIYVKNGEEVQKDDLLLKLNPESVRSELDKAESREFTLILTATRLRAFVDKKPAHEINWFKAIENLSYNTPANSKNISNSIQQDINLLAEQERERENQYKIYREKLNQKESELKQYADSRVDLEKKLFLHEQEEKMYSTLVTKGYVSQRDYITAQRKTLEAVAQLKQVDAKIESSKSALQESQEEFRKLDIIFNKQALQELNQVDAQLLEARYTIQRLADLNKRLLITAPVTGIVKGMTVSPGSVISSAESILEIVPTRGKMLVDCKISTRDIGYVKVGDSAQVKVTAYEFTRYGMIDGKVFEISASTFTNKDGLPYYKAKVSLEKNYVGDDPRYNHLKPGMTVQVDIVTGKKSVIAYLLKPITRGMKESFRER